MVGALGSPTVLAPQPVLLAAGVFQLFPISSAEFTYQVDPAQPQDRLKFAITQPYPEATRATMKEMVERVKSSKPCVMYQDDEFGKNIYNGFMAYMDAANMKPASVTTYKRGATEFSSQIARMKADGCDLVFTATIVRETIGSMTEARKTGWNVPFATSAAANVQDVATLGKEMVDGLYATGLYETPYEDLATPRVKEWIALHRKMFGGDPNTQTIYGYNAIATFACFAGKAGRNLTGETLLSTLESGVGCSDIFGSKPVTYARDRHLHMLAAQLHQIQNGRWVTLKKDLPM
jgi:ABC-type branched-subunit amino acid transport system substrate-binding protein